MDDLYAEGFPTDWDDTLDELLTLPLTARAGATFSNVETDSLISADTIASALQTIYSEHFDPEGDIEPHLLRDIARQLMQAATEGYGTPTPTDDSDGREFLRRLRTDAATFSAFKVHRLQNDMAAQLIGDDGQLKPFEQWSNDVRTIADHQCRHWLRTEYNTAVRRAHEAAEWQRFEAEADALPCLRWMSSTSAQPGADHRQFWGTVLPVDHPFWDSHRPGDRWNCKCSLEQTDDEPTAPPAASDDKPQDRPAPGLDTRPDREAQLFSPSHPYYRDAYRGAAQAARKAVDALMADMEQEKNTAKKKLTERTKQLRHEAAHLKEETFRNSGIKDGIHITGRGIKEWLNQPHKHYAQKNEMLLDIAEVIEKAEYKGHGPDKHDPSVTTHILETNINGEKSWIIVRELNRPHRFDIHSISDSPNILRLITEKPTP